MKRLLALLLFASCAHTQRTPVVFVHGNGANRNQWRAQVDHVSKTRPAVAFDLLGMGESAPAPDGDYSVEAMARDLGSKIDRAGFKRVILVGHSYGGAVVAQYAATHPGRVAGAIYADSAGNVKTTDEAAERFLNAVRRNKDGVAAQWFAPILKPSSEAVRQEVLASVHNTPVEAFTGAFAGLRKIDMAALLRAYPGPKLAIAASDIESPGSLHVQFPELPVKKMSGVGHWLMLDDPARFNQLLDEALDAIDRVGK
jgi:pimeloyl-ACP methyl ester carboxylesterase